MIDLEKHFNKIKGFKGEQIACDFLKKKKFQILQRNYTNKIGEIDIVALDRGVLVFVEVKARETMQYGRPCEAVNFRKQQKLRSTAEIYLITHKMQEHDCRFDVIEVLGDEVIGHIENAF